MRRIKAFILCILLSINILIYSACATDTVKLSYYSTLLTTFIDDFIIKDNLHEKILSWYQQQNPIDKDTKLTISFAFAITKTQRPIPLTDKQEEQLIDHCNKQYSKYPFTFQMVLDEEVLSPKNLDYPNLLVRIFDDYWDVEQNQEYQLRTELWIMYKSSVDLWSGRETYSFLYQNHEWIRFQETDRLSELPPERRLYENPWVYFGIETKPNDATIFNN